MARSKKGGKGKAPKAPKAESTATPVDVPSLIEKSHVLLAQSNFELAIKFLERALELEPANLEARELIGVAELEGGDPEKGRQHLLMLFPPHAEQPTTPSPYLYLAQTAQDPTEALGYYSTATAMIENELNSKGKQRMNEEQQAEAEEYRKMAVTAIVAMIEIWMSDLCFEEAASSNCDALIARALAISPNDHEALMALASIRMSQSKFDEAKEVTLKVYSDLEGRDPFDPMLPGLPARLQFARLLLEHHLHMEALDVLSTVREEDSLQVEGAYLEGWAWHLRAEALLEDPSILAKEKEAAAAAGNVDEDDAPLSADECFSESLRCLLECAKLFTEQDYPDEGIGKHLNELLTGLKERGVQPAVQEEVSEGGANDGGEWEDEADGDVDMS